ncbi:MAG: hypothetical protein ACJ8R9_28295 [Steroidobacteraceae bacterium]
MIAEQTEALKDADPALIQDALYDAPILAMGLRSFGNCRVVWAWAPAPAGRCVWNAANACRALMLQ